MKSIENNLNGYSYLDVKWMKCTYYEKIMNNYSLHCFKKLFILSLIKH